jgi:hypothetical protein
MLFSMVDGQREISCAISTSAMDDLEGVARSRPDQREAKRRSAKKLLQLEA